MTPLSNRVNLSLMVSFSVRLDEALHEAATERAGEKNQSLVAHIRELLLKDIEQRQRQKILLWFDGQEEPVEVTYEYV